MHSCFLKPFRLHSPTMYSVIPVVNITLAQEIMLMTAWTPYLFLWHWDLSINLACACRYTQHVGQDAVRVTTEWFSIPIWTSLNRWRTVALEWTAHGYVEALTSPSAGMLRWPLGHRRYCKPLDVDRLRFLPDGMRRSCLEVHRVFNRFLIAIKMIRSMFDFTLRC